MKPKNNSMNCGKYQDLEGGGGQGKVCKCDREGIEASRKTREVWDRGVYMEERTGSRNVPNADSRITVSCCCEVRR